ncbi:MAG: hypothetical protein ACKV2Q_36660 [Planctomycetaceae bacterium]
MIEHAKDCPVQTYGCKCGYQQSIERIAEAAEACVDSMGREYEDGQVTKYYLVPENEWDTLFDAVRAAREGKP